MWYYWLSRVENYREKITDDTAGCGNSLHTFVCGKTSSSAEHNLYHTIYYTTLRKIRIAT